MPARLTMALLAACTACTACGDAGDDWHAQGGLPELYAVYDVWAFSPEDVRAAASGGTVLLFDGAEWTASQTPIAADVTDLWAFGPDDIWAVGGSSVLHWDGSDWSVVVDTSQFGLDGLTGVWGSSPSDIFVVGDDGIVVHYDGATWSSSLAGVFNEAVWGSGPNDVWVLGTFELNHWDGQMWSEVDAGISGGEGAVWGTGPNDIWVVNDTESSAHWNGSSWTVYEPDSFVGTLTALWGAGPDELWAVGGFGSIARFANGEWEELAHQAIGSPQLRYFFAVHGSSASNIWAVGQVLDERGATGIIYRYEP